MDSRSSLIIFLCFTCGLLTAGARPAHDNSAEKEEKGVSGLRKRCPNQNEPVESAPRSGRRHTSKTWDECCPDGWSRFDSQCFMFFHGPMTWIDAELTCLDVGGNLASVHSAEDNQFLRDLVSRVTGTHAHTWIGGHDGVKEGVWLWSDGSKFEYLHWGAGEPNNEAGHEHCLAMNWGGHLWNDFPCISQLPFVCSQSATQAP